MQSSHFADARDLTTTTEASRTAATSDTATPRIAIVGVGFTGTLLAVHLLREAKAPLTIHLIEQHGWFGRGVAYSTGNPSHLLNVRVANMSALPDEPADFLLWLWRLDYNVDGLPIPPSGHAFVPRSLYGAYLEDALLAACKSAAPGVTCRLRAAEAVGVRRGHDRYLLSFRSDAPMAFDRVVLCIGNLTPALPCATARHLDRPRYIADPWHEPALTDIPPEVPVAIIGTGLTAVDVVLSLLDQQHKGPIVALSRRGLLPQQHAETRSYHDFMAGEPAPESLLGLFARLRTEICKAEAIGFDWRSVIDAFRPHTERCWQALPRAERRRFLRHVRSYWEVHRHRMAPQTARRLWDAFRSGQLARRKGRLIAIEDDGADLVVHYRSRNGRMHHLRVAHVINSSGPQCDISRVDHPLLKSVLQQGLALPDPLGLGLEVASDFQLLGADGKIVPGLMALGPIARGRSWELTAVPELRSVCARAGRMLAEQVPTITAPNLRHITERRCRRLRQPARGGEDALAVHERKGGPSISADRHNIQKLDEYTI